MADTAIEWADRVWNPTTGCDRVSPGCDHCYAMTMAKRLKGMGSAKYQNDGDPRTSGPGFAAIMHTHSLDEVYKWRKPQRIFVNSMSDLFHDDVDDYFIWEVFARMAACPQHTFQVLTKRHARMRSFLNGPIGHPYISGTRWPLPNVWMGISAENQQWADIRIPALLDTPAAIRFVSAEPLLGPIDMSRFLRPERCSQCGGDWTASACGPTHAVIAADPGLHWVIAGGESGHGARPMHPRWVESLHQQCESAGGVAFLFKQWGEWTPMAPLGKDGKVEWRGCHSMTDDGNLYAPGDLTYPDGPRYGEAFRADFPHHHPTSMYRVGKHRAGRELYHDGRTFDGYPEAVAYG